MKPRKLTSRQAFERWAKKAWCPPDSTILDRLDTDSVNYRHHHVDNAWYGWQAAIRFERSRARGKK